VRIVEREIEVGDSGVYLVQVAATTINVEYDISQFRAALVTTFTLLAVALAGATLLQVRFGLRPLRRLQEEVAAIRRGESEKIGASFSDDLAPLAGELNLLISSNREILERARTQVGNLAHALKTPLSVITNEARAESSPLAAKVAEQSEIMRNQVTWYLDRARAAARSGVIGSVTEVEPVVAALTRTFEKIYDERAVAFSSHVEPGLRFRGEKQDFEEMLGNLVDNAGKWAKAQVDVAARAVPDAAQPMIEVTIDDDGPGLPEENRAAALARGRRLDETKPGSGLGLSIVVDLSALYGGKVWLEDSPAGGLRARLRLPSA
jgi:signal transduction histidine kinase